MNSHSCSGTKRHALPIFVAGIFPKRAYSRTVSGDTASKAAAAGTSSRLIAAAYPIR